MPDPLPTEIIVDPDAALLRAAEAGDADAAARALRAGADVEARNDLQQTALLEAVILGDGSDRYVETVRVLLEGGADPSIPDGDGVTAAEHARRKGFRGISQALSG